MVIVSSPNYWQNLIVMWSALMPIYVYRHVYDFYAQFPQHTLRWRISTLEVELSFKPSASTSCLLKFSPSFDFTVFLFFLTSGSCAWKTYHSIYYIHVQSLNKPKLLLVYHHHLHLCTWKRLSTSWDFTGLAPEVCCVPPRGKFSSIAYSSHLN